MLTILIPPTQNVATSNNFSAVDKNNIGLCCNGLQGTETITIQVYDPVNKIWAPAIYNSQVIQLNVNSNFTAIWEDANIYRLVKSTTASAVGIGTYSDVIISQINL